MNEIVLPAIIEGLKDDKYPTPEEYSYWKARQNRTFYIDYDIDETYSLIELSKIIIDMNIDEKDIPKKDLKPIRLMIQSYGGDIEQANYFCDLIKSSRIPIITVGLGVCMSAGFLIFISGHKRYAFKHCQMLIHEGSAAFQGTAAEIEQAQKNYRKQLDEMKEYILERTAISEKIFDKNKTKDWYLTPQELLDYKVIDKFITDISIIL